MEKRTQLHIGLLLSTLVCVPSLYGIISSATQDTFAANINTAVLDKATGDFYVGTVAAGAGTDFNIIGKFSVPTGSTLTKNSFFTAAANTHAINALTLSRSGTVTRAVFSRSAPAGVAHFLTVTDGVTTGIMAEAVKNATPVAGVVAGLAANDIAAIAAIGTGVNWVTGDNLGGIASHLINATTLVPAATPATAGVYTAGRFVGVTAAVNTLGFSIATAITATPGNSPKLVYDSVFSKLYVGQSITTAANGGDGGRSLLIMSVDPTTASLTPVIIKTNPALTWTDKNAGENGNIVGDLHAAAVATNLSVSNLGIMHTSTGLSYLIVNGGHGLAAATGNQVWALPLVTKGFTNEGTLADVTSPMFNAQANGAATLYTEVSTPAIVGNTVLPWQVTTIPNQMQIVGDTVYICSNLNAATTNESGIMYSTAIFGPEGKIVRWTRWEKAQPTGMGTGAADGSINFFGVDARSGRVWSVPEVDAGGNPRIVRISSWDTSTTATTLQGAISASTGLPEGVYSMYSLGRSSVNFGQYAQGKYTLFGGQGKVAFTRTDVSDADPAGAQNTPQTTPPTDFSSGDNFLLTTLPAGAGAVQALGFSHFPTPANGFFLAGTNAGLYAYAVTANGAGLNVDLPMNLLSNAQFAIATRSWQAITSITGAVRKIKSNGLCLYVLARDNNGGVVTDTLYRITDQNSVANLIADTVTLAVSGTGSLANAATIEDFEIVQWAALPNPSLLTATAAAPTQEQVILATGDGLYESRAATGLNLAGNNTQALALWTKIESEEVYTRLFAQNRLENVTNITGSYVRDNVNKDGTYTSSFLNHIIAQGTNVFTDPEHYTSNDTSIIYPGVVTSYWSDGARRVFAVAPGDGTLKLQSLPYKTDSTNFNMTAPIDQVNAVQGKTVYAVGQIPNGHLCACLGPDGIVLG